MCADDLEHAAASLRRMVEAYIAKPTAARFSEIQKAATRMQTAWIESKQGQKL